MGRARLLRGVRKGMERRPRDVWKRVRDPARRRLQLTAAAFFASRAIQHISQLLDSISQFPRASSPSTADLDIHRLQRQIRSRYRALCSSLGIRPRLQTASSQTSESEMSEVRVALGSSIPVWKIDKKTGSKSAVTNMDLDF